MLKNCKKKKKKEEEIKKNIKKINTNACHHFPVRGDLLILLVLSKQQSKTQKSSIYNGIKKGVGEQILTFEQLESQNFWHFCLINDRRLIDN